MKKNYLINLISQLISIPSYVDNRNDERELLNFLEKFFKQNFPTLIISRQYLDSKNLRYNLIIQGKGKPKLFILGHIDTVQPKKGWLSDPFKPIIKNNRIYGLGAADMKGSLASFLSALKSKKEKINLEELYLFFYVDEEYDFKGMRTFIEKINMPSPPSLILSLDGELKVASGCRGLIEITLTIRGKSGHSSNTTSGTNTITKSLKLFEQLEKKLLENRDQFLGKTTLNVAYIQGGVVSQNGRKLIWQREGNIIPDFVDITIEVRPSLAKINASYLSKQIKNLAKLQKLKIETISIRHDLPPWQANYNEPIMKIIKDIYQEADVSFKKSFGGNRGYVDVQMLTQVINSPSFVIGSGGENRHGANEYVAIENLEKLTKIYKTLLKKFLDNRE